MDFEPGRYARHRLLDWFDQERVAELRALVVGAGAIGNEVLKNLALLGVKNISIVDLDHIEIHNLTRSVLFRESDIGRFKASVAAQRVGELLPEGNARAIEGPLETTLRPSLLAKFDVVFSCLDNFEARLALDEMSMIAGVNVISGAIDARYASVELYPYATSRRCGCYTCNLPPGAFHRVAQRYSCGWLRRIGLVEKKVPTTIITSSLVGSMMVSWGLRLGKSSEDEAPTSKRLLVDTFSGLGSSSVLPHSQACPSCNQLQPRVEVLQWHDALRFPGDAESRQLRVRVPTEVIFSARCAECGYDASSLLRPGSRLRDFSTDARTCPVCLADSVAIDARDVGTLEDFANLRIGKPPEVPYVMFDIGSTTFCLET